MLLEFHFSPVFDVLGTGQEREAELAALHSPFRAHSPCSEFVIAKLFICTASNPEAAQGWGSPALPITSQPSLVSCWWQDRMIPVSGGLIRFGFVSG